MNKTKSVLITGGSGLIGSELCVRLSALGYNIRILTRARSSDKRYEQFEWDPAHNRVQEGALDGVWAIVHLAGASIADKKWTRARKKVLTSSRIQTASLLYSEIKKMSQEERPQVFVSASGTGFYGYDTGAILVREGSRFGDDFLATLTKEWEGAADEFQNLGCRVVKLRTGFVMSDKGGALPVMARPIRFWSGAPLGRGEQYISWIHIDDLVSIYVKAIDDERLVGPYNAVGPEPVTNREFTKSLAKALGKPLFLPNVPSFVLRLLLGEMASLVLGGNKVSSEKIVGTGFSFKFPSLNLALANLYK